VASRGSALPCQSHISYTVLNRNLYFPPMNRIQRIQGVIQPYAWGGRYFIADLLGQEKPSTEPQAELWMGTHPKGTATIIIDGQTQSLSAFLEKQNMGDGLPYLFKVLDVHSMLSIQCHPNTEEARIGFEKEEKEGIPLTAFHRVFRDPNPKPEMMLALTDFFLLHGFRTQQEIQKAFGRFPLWNSLHELASKSIATVYRVIMEYPQETINELLAPLREELLRKPVTGYTKTDPDHWARKALDEYKRENGDLDRGIFSIYMLQLLHLRPGEAIFQDAGILHAYLEGVNIELMANSDNVFRGGLTVKHIDVDQLMNHAYLDHAAPTMVTPEKHGAITRYPSSANAFELRQLKLDANQSKEVVAIKAPNIWLVLEGTGTIGENMSIQKGDQLFLTPGQSVTVHLKGEDPLQVMIASTP